MIQNPDSMGPKIGEIVADKSLAKALKRKMGLDEDILTKGHVITGDVSLLMNASRRRIFRYVCNNPCSHLRDLSRKLDISPQTARWHLSKLSEGGLLAKIAKGKKTLFFPNYGIIGERECEVFSLLRREDVLKIYLFITKHPEVTQGTISQSVGTYQQKLSMKLTSLEDAGLIGHKRIGRMKAYSTTDRVKNAQEKLEKGKEIYKRWLMDVLTEDGVNPNIISDEAETLSIRLDFGTAESSVFTINKNPLATLLGGGEGNATP